MKESFYFAKKVLELDPSFSIASSDIKFFKRYLTGTLKNFALKILKEIKVILVTWRKIHALL